MPGPCQRKPASPVLPSPRRGLVLSLPYTAGIGTPRNLVDGAGTVAAGGAPGWTAGPYGPARNFPVLGGNDSEEYTLPRSVDWGNGPFSVEVWATFRQFQAGAPFISGVWWNGGSAGNSNHIRLGDAGVPNNAVQFAVNGNKQASVARLVAGVPYQLGMTYDGVTLIGYVNGNLDSRLAVGAGGAASTDTWFGRDDTTTRAPDALFHGANIWTRVLPPTEWAERYRDLGAIWRGGRRTPTAILGAPAGVVVRVPWHLFFRRGV